jgi:hypothetical protein
MGDDKENYRWTYLTKNSEQKDDYSRVMAMAGCLTRAARLRRRGWRGSGRRSMVAGAGLFLRQRGGGLVFRQFLHNGQFYARPSDGRMLYFPHDMDFSFSATRPIFTNTELQKLTVDPARRRAYLGHLHDVCTTVFNQSYMAAWTATTVPCCPMRTFPGHLNYINTRSNYILNAINSRSPRWASPSPPTAVLRTFSTEDTPVTLAAGLGSNVREIRLAGATSPLGVKWTSTTSWEALVPVGAGANTVMLEAVDLSGQVVGTDSIVITNTGSDQLPGSNNLVVSEIYYNPLMADDMSEYIELLNISATASIDLSGLAVSDGITFSFANQVRLLPGARVLLVKNQAGFESEFGTGHPVAGVFTGSLDNAGEVLTLRRADNTLVRTFAYSDDPPWPTIADTAGHSIVLVDPFANPDHGDPLSWRASNLAGGSPGGSDTLEYGTWKAAYGNPADDIDADGDGLTTRVEYVLGGNPLMPDQGLAPTFELEAGGSMLLSVTRRADAGANVFPESSGDLVQWGNAQDFVFLSNVRLPGTPALERLTFRAPGQPDAKRRFVRFAIR